jgi:hypothetical protein
MTQNKKEIRDIMIMIRMNKTEHNRLLLLRKKTIEKNNSTYIRKMALGEPITVIYRNGSADDFLNEMIALKRELYAIGNNFNQAVHKLHTLEKIPEFRSWIADYGKFHQLFLTKTEEILIRANQFYQQWSQG